MKTLILNIFLALIWLALTMKFTLINIFFGFAAGYIVLLIISRNKNEKKYFSRLPRAVAYITLFSKEVIKGSLKIGADIITPRHNMHPAIMAVPLDAKTDIEITLLANSITLTPGTTSLAVSHDRKTLYVYNVYADKDIEKSIAEIKNGLEKKLLEVLR
ncbi:MAG: Na+/H+ antiporter subunit E [Bacteroidales bacterium]